jgi:hypothetical protein
MERGELDYDLRVVEVWPEFGSHGKDKLTLRQFSCTLRGPQRYRRRAAGVGLATFMEAASTLRIGAPSVRR